MWNVIILWWKCDWYQRVSLNMIDSNLCHCGKIVMKMWNQEKNINSYWILNLQHFLQNCVHLLHQVFVKKILNAFIDNSDSILKLHQLVCQYFDRRINLILRYSETLEVCCCLRGNFSDWFIFWCQNFDVKNWCLYKRG